MKKGKKIYIAGPMRGKDRWNLTAFLAAEASLRAEGWHVFNPAAIVQALNYPLTYPCEPGGGEGADEHLAHVMLSDFACLLHCDAIALLSGWEESRGATAELALAQFLGLEVLCAQSLRPIRPRLTPWADKTRCDCGEVKHVTALCRVCDNDE